MKRFLGLVLSAIMLTFFSVPGAAAAPADNAIDFNEKPYTLVVCYPVLSEAQPDLPLIQEAISEIALREINAKVEFEAVSLFSMANIYALKASSREKMDLMMMMPGSNYLAPFVTSKMLRPIDEEIDKWGWAIKEVLGETLEAGKFLGKQYAVPQNKDFEANGYGYNLSVPLCEKYDINIDDIKTVEDLEAAFEIIHKNEPGVIVITPEQSGGTIVTSLRGKIDSLGTTVAALEIGSDGSLNVVSSYGQEAYMEGAKKVREWYNNGYISKDVTTTKESGSQLLWGGKAFANSASSLGASMGGVGNGLEYRSVLTDELFRTTSDSQMSSWAVPVSSSRPDKAIQFLNLAFDSEEIGNLFRYGIEGNHHKILEDGSAELANTAGWQNNWYILGDYNKMMIRSDAISAAGVSYDEFIDLANEWNDKVASSPAYGFTFDPAKVRTETAACDTVIDEYSKVIGNGKVDPEKEIPKFLQKLNESGLQTVLDEVQRQLDEWAAAQK